MNIWVHFQFSAVSNNAAVKMSLSVPPVRVFS